MAVGLVGDGGVGATGGVGPMDWMFGLGVVGDGG